MRRCPEREDHVKTESFSDISTSQGMPKTSAKLPKDKENQTLLYRFQRAHDPATNFILDFQSPEWQYSGLLLPQHIQFVTLCYSSLLDLILGVIMTDYVTFLCCFLVSTTRYLVVRPKVLLGPDCLICGWKPKSHLPIFLCPQYLYHTLKVIF